MLLCCSVHWFQWLYSKFKNCCVHIKVCSSPDTMHLKPSGGILKINHYFRRIMSYFLMKKCFACLSELVFIYQSSESFNRWRIYLLLPEISFLKPLKIYFWSIWKYWIWWSIRKGTAVIIQSFPFNVVFNPSYYSVWKYVDVSFDLQVWIDKHWIKFWPDWFHKDSSIEYCVDPKIVLPFNILLYSAQSKHSSMCFSLLVNDVRSHLIPS